MSNKLNSRRFGLKVKTGGKVSEIIKPLPTLLTAEENLKKQYKCTFVITIEFGSFISYADIAIYNISDDTRNKLKRDSVIEFSAGYADTIDAIFKGRIVNVIPERHGASIITRIIARGGTQPKAGIISKTLGKNAKLTDIITECAKQIGYPLVINEDGLDNIYPRGYSLFGDPREILAKLAATHNFGYVIENDRIIVVKNGKSRKLPVKLIDQYNGMEGSPQVISAYSGAKRAFGIKVAVRLSPKIRIGGKIEVKAKFATFSVGNLNFNKTPPAKANGIYTVKRIVHEGDSWGDTWTTNITAYR